MLEAPIKKAKEILARLEQIEKDFAFSGQGAGLSSPGYFNRTYDPEYSKKVKKKRKKLLV